MITKNISFSRSLIVLAHLEAISIYSDIEMTVGAYQNGREHGIAITYSYEHSFSIAEHRNSDNIVVYEGKVAMQGLSESAYENKRFFATELEAATHVFNRLLALSSVERLTAIK